MKQRFYFDTSVFDKDFSIDTLLLFERIIHQRYAILNSKRQILLLNIYKTYFNF